MKVNDAAAHRAHIFLTLDVLSCLLLCRLVENVEKKTLARCGSCIQGRSLSVGEMQCFDNSQSGLTAVCGHTKPFVNN
jgi:hypothetical protein